MGCYFYQWNVADNCGNIGSSGVAELCIVDDIVPTAICDEITTISLSSDGLAVINAETFDDGSYDNCCLERMEVRRMTSGCGLPGNTVFGETVTFCCEDVSASPVMVAMQVVDCSGNTNQCMVEVIVEDKLAPSIVCPANDKISCDEYADILASALLSCDGDDTCESATLTTAGFGVAQAFDNCALTITPVVSINIDQCGVGSVTRSFSATDASNNGPAVCTQTITVYQVSDFVVEFPADVEGLCDQAQPSFGEPEIFFETCELVAVSFEDQVFDVVPDACFKVVRQWTVINWCVVGDAIDEETVENPENALGLPFPACDLDGDGDCDDRTFRDSWSNGVYPGRLATDFPGVACNNIGPDTDPDSDGWDGFITYQQVIKVQDLEAPVIDPAFELATLCIISGNDGTDNNFDDCAYSGILPTPAYSDCIIDVNGENEDGDLIENDVVITTEVFDAAGNLVAGSTVLNNLPIGCYTARYSAVDRCGNATATDYDFCIEDCKFPTPYCKDGIVLELMHINDPNNTTFEPMVELWAADLDEGSYDNCPGGVQLSFSSAISDTGMTFNCDNLGENAVQLWVTDASGNQDFCETFVIIQANQQQCSGINGDPSIAGTVATEDAEGVENVEIFINSNAAFNANVTTDQNGYFYMEVPQGNDYTVTPFKDSDHLNGVTTFDLVKITKHILNIESLDSPYKMIAADANNSGSITTLDLVHIRKLILLIDNAYSNNTSWRFVDASYVFPDPLNPWAEDFPEIVNLNNLMDNGTDNNFVAVKIGDVNGNAQTNGLSGADDRTFEGSLIFNTEDRWVTAGEEFTVYFTSANFNVSGYQFTLNFDDEKLAFSSIHEGVANAQNFGLSKLEQGAITTSWNSDRTQLKADDEVIFGLNFKAMTDGKLSEMVYANSRFTTAEAYGDNDELYDIALVFKDENSAFELYQNVPNPVAKATTIGFNLPEGDAGVLTIFDMNGRIVFSQKNTYETGYNEITINANQLGAAGVYYYQLKTSEHVAMKKMILD